jgi:hypothetical protein
VADNLAIWNALGKTDPAATKAFRRGGGFSGTAVKPMWIIKRLTEQFGPAGTGWGVNKPEFQVVEGGGDVLVYCTVSAWHSAKENVLWGVGGDKVAGKNKNGPFSDDEAFKKAFTDAVNNAFKSIGVAADIHMGLFDDDKYVTQARADFAAESEPAYEIELKLEEILACETQMALKRWWKDNSETVPPAFYDQILEATNKRADGIKLMDRSVA